MPTNALEMDHVSKKFKKGEIYDSLRDLIPAFAGRLLKKNKKMTLDDKEFWAVNDVSFQVNEGEALGIIGLNGAGKSTILKLLCGIMKPTKGVLKVNGTLSALIEVGAGFHGDLTGRENIFLNGTILGMKKDKIKQKFDEIVDFSGLKDFIDTPVKRYSSGMYARLGFSVAAHVNPKILIVDEVLSVGDYAFQNKCAERMKAIVKNGTSVIFVSHQMKAITDLCDRCILLEQGKVAMNGPTREVVSSYMNPADRLQAPIKSKECYISKVNLKGETNQTLIYESGEKVTVAIEIIGNTTCDNLSVSVALLNENDIVVFNTSSQRLNNATFTLESGEKKRIIFNLNLHLVPGTYRIEVYIYRYDIQKTYDILTKIFQIKSEMDVRGIANLYPEVRFNDVQNLPLRLP